MRFGRGYHDKWGWIGRGTRSPQSTFAEAKAAMGTKVLKTNIRKEAEASAGADGRGADDGGNGDGEAFTGRDRARRLKAFYSF